MNKTLYFLSDILTYLQHIERFTANGCDFFMGDKKTQFAVEYAYEVIGEAVKRLPADLLSAQPHINWQSLSQFGDYLAHHYDAIDLAQIWTHIEDLPTLRTAVEALLAEQDKDKE